jgi:hypothetical protein
MLKDFGYQSMDSLTKAITCNGVMVFFILFFGCISGLRSGTGNICIVEKYKKDKLRQVVLEKYIE